MSAHAQSLEREIRLRMEAQGPGAVFTPADFLDLGTRAAVDQALSRQARRGHLRRVARGLYDLPRSHRIWGPLPAAPEAVVAALARRDGLRVLPPQGPAGPFLTDGRSRRLKVGKALITLQHAAARRMALADMPGGDQVLLWRALGREGAGMAARERIRWLDEGRKAELREARRLAPGWLSDLLKELGC